MLTVLRCGSSDCNTVPFRATYFSTKRVETPWSRSRQLNQEMKMSDDRFFGQDVTL
jgi:hypothetical protein